MGGIRFSSFSLGRRGLLKAEQPQSLLFGKRCIHSILLEKKAIPLVISPFPRFSRCFHLGTEETPNPDSLKFFPGTQLMPDGRTHNFSSRESSLCSPLAMRLFEVEGVKSAFFGLDYITINKDESVEWIEIQPDIYSAFSDFFSSGEALFSRDPDEFSPPRKEVDYDGDDEEVVEMIKELIDVKVRPMVQEDGGDVEFLKFEEGVVFLRMQGACSGCPSAPATLKGGIERMLMHWVPEVQGVVGVEGDEELATINHAHFTEFEQTLNEEQAAQQDEVKEIVDGLKKDKQ